MQIIILFLSTYETMILNFILLKKELSYVYVHVQMFLHMLLGDHRSQKRALDPLELQLVLGA